MPTSTRTPARPSLATAAAILLVLTPVLAAGDTLKKYGAGTPGSGNVVPTVWGATTPRPGANFALDVERALGGSYGVLFLATQPAEVTFEGVRFLIDVSAAHLVGTWFLDGAGHGAGRGRIPLPIPGAAVLVGRDFYAQVFTLDDLAPNPLGFGATEGLRITPALPGQVVAARARPGQPDPQTAIDLASGQAQDFDQGLFTDGTGFTFSRDGRLLFAAPPDHSKVHIFDTSTFPPQWRQQVAVRTSDPVRFVATSPDGTRAYVVPNGRQGSSPRIEVLNAGGLALGQPHAAGDLRVEGIADCVAAVFDCDCHTLFLLSAEGSDANGAELIAVDVRLGSPTYHTEIGRAGFPGRKATAAAIAADGRTVYVSLGQTSAYGELAIVDAGTLAVFDADANAPGVQHLGGETSRPRTPLPRSLTHLVPEPRGGAVFFATVGGFGRLRVDPFSVEFRQVTAGTAGVAHNATVVAIAAADAGERLYLATGAEVIEVDPTTFTRVRAWPIRDTVALAVR